MKKGLTALFAVVLIITIACNVNTEEQTAVEKIPILAPVEEVMPVEEVVPEVLPEVVPQDNTNE
tara:strand:+ start:10623 stop:10814 length:192 start_codon:yes stop_codon:yes gene_type:complete